MLEHIKRRDVIFIVALVVFVFSVLFFYQGRNFSHDKPKGAASQNSAAQTATAAKQQYLKRFEASLNDLLKGIFVEVNDYRERRRILNNIVRPENLRNAQYISEGYALALQTIPDLQARSVSIIAKFGEKEAEIKRLIKDRPADAQKTILSEWNSMKGEQVDLYVQYFTIEQNILDRYQSLIGLYYQNRQSVIYDEVRNIVSFEGQGLNARAGELSQDITHLKKEQAALTQ